MIGAASAGDGAAGAALSRPERLAAALFEGVAVALMALLLAAVGWSVLARQVLHIPVPWATEVSAALCLWLVATGSVAAWARREHIVIDVLLRRLGPKGRRGMGVVIEVGSLVLFAVVLDGAVKMMSVSANNVTTALQVSFTWLYLALAVAAAGMAAFSLAHLARLIGWKG